MNVFPKRTYFVLIGIALILLTSACGTTTSTGSTQTPSTVALTPASSSTFTILTAQVTVNGKATTILTDAQGKALYYFTPDTATKLACIGGCAKAWPPLILTSSNSPTSSPSLPGTLSVLNGANGNQVEYGGYLLYTYSGDTAPGQIKGQGLFGRWYLATPDMASYVIRIATAKVKGKAETILSTPKGLTLYYFTPDTEAKTACTGGCAKAWPPLFFSGSGTPLVDASLSGTPSVLNDTNGNQVEYNGHLLYTYFGDTAPGQIKGQGLFGKWFIATPGLAA